MQITDLPFGITDWATIEPTEHAGEAGIALWRTRQFGPIRVRMVEYSPGYRADHWCEKGHILLCVAGEMDTELRDGRRFHLRAGVSYQVADHAEPHRSYSATGATLFIVDRAWSISRPRSAPRSVPKSRNPSFSLIRPDRSSNRGVDP